MRPGDVAMARLPAGERPYPEFPYDPGEALPEFPSARTGGPNPVHAAVRQALGWLGMDAGHYGTPVWNPLGEIIQPGQRVLVKPNWVYHENRVSGGLPALVTHTSVLRAVMDYVLLALRGSGRLILGDAPIQSADFGQIRERLLLDRLLGRLDARGVDVQIRDFRESVCRLDARGRVLGHRSLPGDPGGYCTVDLGSASRLSEVSDRSRDFRVTNYDPAAMRAHHSPGRHEYRIARAVLESDAVINVPKLKTHRKAGLTCCLKNVVGINGSKDYLPHHRVGPRQAGGDEYQSRCFWKAVGSRLTDWVEAAPDSLGARPARLGLRILRRLARRFAADPYEEGSWFGNDTIWRTVMDLHYVLAFARPDGSLASRQQRTVFHIVDAVVVGGGEGPLRPEAVPAGMILAGRSPAAVDGCAARLVGLDPGRIPLLRNALDAARSAKAEGLDVCLVSGPDAAGRTDLDQVRPVVYVEPPAGWAGHVELEGRRRPHEADRQQSSQAPAEFAEE